MATASLKIKLNCNQVLDLARQLSDEDILMLNEKLAAEARIIKLKRLMSVLKNDEISLNDLNSEVDLVRQKLYEERQRN